eukprot:jgi/Chlat1/2189/Chrsp17S02743
MVDAEEAQVGAAGGDEGIDPHNQPKAVKRKRTADGAEISLSKGDNAKEQKKAKAAPGRSPELKKLSRKYRNGPVIATKAIKDKKLKGKLKSVESIYDEAAVRNAQAEKWLLPAEGGFLEAEGLERTYRFKQEEVVEALDANSARKAFNLKLADLGPYNVDFTLNGRHLLIGGRKGHIALFDWMRFKPVTELHVKETTRDVKFLHSHQYFAVAQKKYVYIYDDRGIELHCLKEHTEPHKLEFLPQHFLLCSIGASGVLHYQASDSSTGAIVAQHRTRLGRCDVMSRNPYNSVINLGHSNGVVSLWTPNLTTAAAKIFCHKGPVTAVAVDQGGHKLVTAGLDGQVKVWDIRTYKPLHSYFSVTPAKHLEISQKGMLGVGYGPHIQVWKDALDRKQVSPYMNHLMPGVQVQDFGFCPYDDVMAVGHSAGVASLIFPGSGEPNYDTFVANPYETRKQKREAEVHRLLDKIQPELITLDPEAITTIQRLPKEQQMAMQREQEEANRRIMMAKGLKSAMKDKAKGRSKDSKKYKKKQSNVIDSKSLEVEEREKAKRQAAAKEAAQDGQKKSKVPEGMSPALARFYR